jgi:tetratricopeptide (TPR) repeat protein
MRLTVAQIYISDNNEPASGQISAYMNSVMEKAVATGWKYAIYNDGMIRSFLRNRYEKSVLAAYDKLTPYSYKADLARYCILYAIGGWHLDAGVDWALNDFDVKNSVDLIAFRDIQRNSNTSWACSPGIIYARPSHPAIRKAIDIALENIENSRYGFTPLCPTGPTVWGAAIAQTGLTKGVIIGDFMHTTPSYKHKNTVYILPSGQIIARWKPHMPLGGRLNECGGKGLNNYIAFWVQRKAFGEIGLEGATTRGLHESKGSKTHAARDQSASALGKQGTPQESETTERNMLEQVTDCPVMNLKLGTSLALQGKFRESLPHLRAGLAIRPEYPEAHTILGIALLELGHIQDAIGALTTALKLRPVFPQAHCSLGNALQAQGNLEAAVIAYAAALRLEPNYAEAHYNLGNALMKQGDITAAIASFKQALESNPNFPESYYSLGNAFLSQGNSSAAIAAYTVALRLKPIYPEAHNNLGNALMAQGDIRAAIASFSQALELNPSFPEAYFSIGNALRSQGNLSAAITAYTAALALNQNYPAAHNNLAIALKETGCLSAAIESYGKALQHRPNYPDALANLSHCLLLANNYKDGWESYEYRHKRQKPSLPHANPQCQRWDGVIDENATQLLLVSEQGLGDTLQFMRYAITLKERGVSVSICAQPKLHALITASGIDASPLTPQQANQVNKGQWIPLLSVPRHLMVSPENPIITEPYIKTSDQHVAKWKDILSAEQRPIVAINWQGNPAGEIKGLRGRSFPLEAFAPIASIDQASLLSLQKGFGSEQLEASSFRDRFVSCQSQVDNSLDFLDTAAIIANCDLVITSDTAVAHLSAGMGMPTWLLLCKIPDWRWGLEGESTFWYPSMRIFRQKESGSWGQVMQEVLVELRKQSKSPNARKVEAIAVT